MSAQTWSIIAIILFTVAGALFVAAVIMFFVMNIPSIIGDLSGRTLAKGIQNIRNENAYNNSMSAKAANRRNNPNRQFSIGNAYSKETGYTVSMIPHLLSVSVEIVERERAHCFSILAACSALIICFR